MPLLTAIGIVLATLVIGSAMYVVLARFSPEGGRGERTPTSVYAVTAGAMSLLIAFTLSLTFDQYLQAQQAASTEADAVISMSRGAMLMAPKVRDPLRNQLVCYAQDAIDESWPALRDGSTAPQPQMIKTLDTMDAIIAENVPAASPGLDLWDSANEQRLTAHVQLMEIAGDGVPPLLWLLLIFGSLITIGSLAVYADRSKPGWGHVLVVIGPLFIASAALVVIYFFDHPYANSPGSIEPTAMKLALERLTQNQIGTIPLPSCPTSS